MTERVSEDTPLAEAPSGDPLHPEHDASGQVKITTARSGSPSTPGSPREPDSLPDFTVNDSRSEPDETGLLQPGQHHFTSTGAAGVEDPVRECCLEVGHVLILALQHHQRHQHHARW